MNDLFVMNMKRKKIIKRKKKSFSKKVKFNTAFSPAYQDITTASSALTAIFIR